MMFCAFFFFWFMATQASWLKIAVHSDHLWIVGLIYQLLSGKLPQSLLLGIKIDFSWAVIHHWPFIVGLIDHLLLGGRTESTHGPRIAFRFAQRTCRICTYHIVYSSVPSLNHRDGDERLIADKNTTQTSKKYHYTTWYLSVSYWLLMYQAPLTPQQAIPTNGWQVVFTCALLGARRRFRRHRLSRRHCAGTCEVGRWIAGLHAAEPWSKQMDGELCAWSVRWLDGGFWWWMLLVPSCEKLMVNELVTLWELWFGSWQKPLLFCKPICKLAFSTKERVGTTILRSCGQRLVVDLLVSLW